MAADPAPRRTSIVEALRTAPQDASSLRLVLILFGGILEGANDVKETTRLIRSLSLYFVLPVLLFSAGCVVTATRITAHILPGLPSWVAPSGVGVGVAGVVGASSVASIRRYRRRHRKAPPETQP